VNENNAFFVSKNIGQISELIKLESRPEQVNFQIKNLLKSNGFSFVSNHIFFTVYVEFREEFLYPMRLWTSLGVGGKIPGIFKLSGRNSAGNMTECNTA
jgi:hypothetical protein